jgi:hypothetical protein
MAANAAQERISDIGVQGRQAAFENAQQQFERDRAAGLTAAQSNQRAALEADLANQAKNLEALGMGEQSRQFGYQLGEAGRQKAAELGMMSQYQTEELRRAGKELGLQGLQVAGGAAGQLAQFQSQLDDLTLQRARAQMGVGQYQQDYTQQILDQRYQDFLNQRDYNRNTLTWAGGVLHGVPTGTNQTQTTTTPSNPLMGGLGGMMAWNAYNNLWGQGNQAGAGNG